jgi:hypothetical protein
MLHQVRFADRVEPLLKIDQADLAGAPMEAPAIFFGAPQISSRPATLADMRALSATLRPEDRAEIEAIGQKPRHFLIHLWLTSPYRRAYFVDGRIAAVAGYQGTLLSTIGHAWMLTTPEVERVPIGFLKAARQGRDEMLESVSALISGVAASYERSIRFMRLLGFEIGEPHPVPPFGRLFRDLRRER